MSTLVLFLLIVCIGMIWGEISSRQMSKMQEGINRKKFVDAEIIKRRGSWRVALDKTTSADAFERMIIDESKKKLKV